MKINKIRDNIVDVLSTKEEYKTDCSLAVGFLQKREFENLELLLLSIIQKEESKPKPERLQDFAILVEAKTSLIEYMGGLEV